MFLPPRWKDSNISVDDSRIDMDPNLTLAHLTHNTSMILLHYPVAFPPSDWRNLVQLPSSCSAETCQMAAVEISRIAGKFLCHTSIPFVSPQFSFCVYVAAKLLLGMFSILPHRMLLRYPSLFLREKGTGAVGVRPPPGMALANIRPLAAGERTQTTLLKYVRGAYDARSRGVILPPP